MNGAHLHLLLNHLPVLGIPVGLLLVLSAMKMKNEGMLHFSYFFIVGVALASIAAFLTGEPAEDLVKTLPEVTKALIHNHEEAAEIGFILTLISGGLALIALYGVKIDILKRFAPLILKTLIVVLIMSAGTLGYAASLGGLIRHTEIRTAP